VSLEFEILMSRQSIVEMDSSFDLFVNAIVIVSSVGFKGICFVSN
jgi:hypothetical protein